MKHDFDKSSLQEIEPGPFIMAPLSLVRSNPWNLSICGSFNR